MLRGKKSNRDVKDGVSLLLDLFKDQLSVDREAMQMYGATSPLHRSRENVKALLEIEQLSRVQVLEAISTFSTLTKDQLINAAQSLEVITFAKGDFIMIQEEIGDSLFILEEGVVSVTRKVKQDDPNEVAKELAQLGKGAHFGEVSLITSGTNTITTPT